LAREARFHQSRERRVLDAVRRALAPHAGRQAPAAGEDEVAILQLLDFSLGEDFIRGGGKE
jgi:hypothetical protein